MKLKDYMARETKMELERIQKEYNTQYEDANSQMQHAIHGTLDQRLSRTLKIVDIPMHRLITRSILKT